jgi:nitric oxide reductase NorE protein
MTSGAEAAPAAGDIGRKKTALRSGHIPGAGSMWFFIIGDLLIFGVYFVAYSFYRGENQELFLQGQQQLDQGIGVVNTVILLTSSLFVVLGTEAAREGKSDDASRLMCVAFVIGSIFPLMKLLEWAPKIGAGITPGENLFFMYYYIMTGLHLCHVLLGLVILGFVIHNLRKSSNPDVEFVETGAVYWHMVDLLWIVVFALFYLMR